MTAIGSPRLQPFARFTPWTDGTGRPWCGWKRLPVTIPFVITYLMVAWVLFIPAAERRGGLYWIDEEAVGHLLFRIPDLTGDPPRALRSIVTGPWINHDSLQLIYVTALLLLFGIVFEVREGTFRLMLIFFGTSCVGALVAGALLHLVYPHPWDIRLFEVAWNRYWTGGSAGCFGVLGAFAARARRPGLLLAVFVVWECAVWWIVLRNYASAFHFWALAAGFLATRWLLPPIRRDGG
jgi:hypothetical protein